MRFYDTHLWEKTLGVLKLQFCVTSLKIIPLKLLPHLSGANELMNVAEYQPHVHWNQSCHDANVYTETQGLSSWPLLLIEINYNPTWTSNHILSSVWWNYLSLPKRQCCTVEVWEWISNFIPHFVMDHGYNYLLIHAMIEVNRWAPG